VFQYVVLKKLQLVVGPDRPSRERVAVSVGKEG
jgi:hypothetical protein